MRRVSQWKNGRELLFPPAARRAGGRRRRRAEEDDLANELLARELTLRIASHRKASPRGRRVHWLMGMLPKLFDDLRRSWGFVIVLRDGSGSIVAPTEQPSLALVMTAPSFKGDWAATFDRWLAKTLDIDASGKEFADRQRECADACRKEQSRLLPDAKDDLCDALCGASDKTCAARRYAVDMERGAPPGAPPIEDRDERIRRVVRHVLMHPYSYENVDVGDDEYRRRLEGACFSNAARAQEQERCRARVEQACKGRRCGDRDAKDAAKELCDGGRDGAAKQFFETPRCKVADESARDRHERDASCAWDALASREWQSDKPLACLKAALGKSCRVKPAQCLHSLVTKRDDGEPSRNFDLQGDADRCANDSAWQTLVKGLDDKGSVLAKSMADGKAAGHSLCEVVDAARATSCDLYPEGVACRTFTAMKKDECKESDVVNLVVNANDDDEMERAMDKLTASLTDDLMDEIRLGIGKSSQTNLPRDHYLPRSGLYVTAAKFKEMKDRISRYLATKRFVDALGRYWELCDALVTPFERIAKKHASAGRTRDYVSAFLEPEHVVVYVLREWERGKVDGFSVTEETVRHVRMYLFMSMYNNVNDGSEYFDAVKKYFKERHDSQERTEEAGWVTIYIGGNMQHFQPDETDVRNRQCGTTVEWPAVSRSCDAILTSLESLGIVKGGDRGKWHSLLRSHYAQKPRELPPRWLPSRTVPELFLLATFVRLLPAGQPYETKMRDIIECMVAKGQYLLGELDKKQYQYVFNRDSLTFEECANKKAQVTDPKKLQAALLAGLTNGSETAFAQAFLKFTNQRLD